MRMAGCHCLRAMDKWGEGVRYGPQLTKAAAQKQQRGFRRHPVGWGTIAQASLKRPGLPDGLGGLLRGGQLLVGVCAAPD